MIALVEGAERQKTPNEIALNILLAGLTIVFLLAVVTLQPFAVYSGAEQAVIVLVALLVCLIPTTIGGLLSAIGIAGMDRLVQRNVLAMSGRAVEAAGDARRCCSTRPARSRSATGRRPSSFRCPGVDRVRARRRGAARQPRRRDARGPLDRRARQGALRAARARARRGAMLVPFTAQTRMSGVDLDGRRSARAPRDSIREWIVNRAAPSRPSSPAIVDRHRLIRRHPARRRGRRPRARRRPAQGRRQGGSPRTFRRSCGRWASAPS